MVERIATSDSRAAQLATTAGSASGNARQQSIGEVTGGRHDAVGSRPVIEVRDLRMSYGSVDAVCGINLDVYEGEVLAFLGPNGAGKTTTVEILEGFRHRTGGEVSVLGEDPARAGGDWRARIGVVLQESQPEPELSVEECMALYAGYYPRSRSIGETLDLVGLADRPTMRCGQLSGGQRRRLDVALALVGEPELLFLDEPTTGFDPSARRAAWDVIAGLRDLGKTIFLTTHYMEEAGIPCRPDRRDRQRQAGCGRNRVQHRRTLYEGVDDPLSVAAGPVCG